MRRYQKNWDFQTRQNSPLEDIQQDIEFLQGWKKREEDKEKAEKEKRKKKEWPKFSFLETVSLSLLFSVPAGLSLGYLYMQFMINMLLQLNSLEPLLKALPK